MLAENLAEEEGIEAGKQDHATLWMMFACGLGEDESAVRTQQLNAETGGLIETFRKLSRRSYASGLGGLYAYVMLQAHELTADPRFLDEAKAGIAAAMGMRFNLNYQANLTAWGAAACMRLYRITNDAVYAEQSYVYLASFFHNCEIWESELELAVHYRNFLGATCLQDAPYMAIYECFDAFTAFEVYLDDSGPDLDPAVRMLVAEYCKYALDRAWY